MKYDQEKKIKSNTIRSEQTLPSIENHLILYSHADND